MAWPPNPNKNPDDHNVRTTTTGAPPTGQEWRLLEKTLLASIDEQKKARRWNIFFKLLTFLYVFVLIILMAKGCTPSFTGSTQITPTTPHLAVISIDKVISSSTSANAYDVNNALKDAFDNSNAKAIALNINSPGGSPVQSDEIWQMIMDLRAENPDKKVYAVIGDVGASGAYYIASAADEIWVNPSSIVGSIGVIMQGYNVEKLMDKVGVEDRTITSGEYKDILSMSRPMTEEERLHVQSLLDSTHQSFIDAVVKGRGDKLKNPEQNKIFSGLFWTGNQAIELGLADKKGGISQLEKSLELDQTVDYSHQDPVSALFDRFGVQVGKGLGQGVKMELQSTTPTLQ